MLCFFCWSCILAKVNKHYERKTNVTDVSEDNNNFDLVVAALVCFLFVCLYVQFEGMPTQQQTLDCCEVENILSFFKRLFRSYWHRENPQHLSCGEAKP